MDEKRLGRRRVLSGGLASASARLLLRAAVAAPRIMTGTACALADREAGVEEAACHAPFRAEFLAWLREASGRFALPVSAHAEAPSDTKLRVPGVHPALDIAVESDCGINVYVDWDGVFWDILASMDVSAEPAPDRSGWRNELFVPEAQRLRPTREACWREDGFEWLLEWVNGGLAPATHVGLFRGDGWTSAHLVRDGVIPRTGRPAASNGSLVQLLPLHATGA